MYFSSGPPRTYWLVPEEKAVTDRFEDVALCLDPSQRFLARVTSRVITIWAASATGDHHPRFRQRQLLSIARHGGHVAKADTQAAEDAKELASAEGNNGDADAATATQPSAPVAADGLPDEECQLQSIWALWLTDDKLAVVEKGSQVVEFYGLDVAPVPLPGENEAAEAAKPIITGAFLEEYPLNQGDSKRDHEDFAYSMHGIAGGKYVFVGMHSGMICVVEVSPKSESSSWYGAANMTKIWKIDVLPHLTAPSSSAPPSPPAAESTQEGDAQTPKPPPSQVPTCYALTCATADPADRITTLYLVACFENGKCFIMLVSPAVKSIDQLLSLVNSDRSEAAAQNAAANSNNNGTSASNEAYGRCTVAALDGSGSRLALGWTDGGVSLFRLITKKPTGEAKTPTLSLEAIRELTMHPWGYLSQDIGGVVALAWTADARAIAVGYELRGFALFSMDGCRLMSSLPQHNQQRPDANDEFSTKEICPYGVLRLVWAKESTGLLVAPRGEQYRRVINVQERRRSLSQELEAPPQIHVNEFFEEVVVDVQKDKHGLCLSLAGAPGRCGAWVRTESSFTRLPDGSVGPAEACGKIEGGDLLIGINDDPDVVNQPFDVIVKRIKDLPNNQPVRLHFLRLQWEKLFPIAVEALNSLDFMEQHGIQLPGDEDLCIREYALRMQVLHGDCDVEERPPLLEFERRAKFDGWEAIQGTSTHRARQNYIKMLFALFPIWNPVHILNVVVELARQVAQRELEIARMKMSRRRTSSVAGEVQIVRKRSNIAFAELDFARSMSLCGRTSGLALLEATKVRLMPARALDDPCTAVSCVSWSVPMEYEAKCCPLRLIALSASGNQAAIAGQRGFCLLNQQTGKWRMFGNVNEEHDMFVYALLWLQDDVVLVSYTKVSEDHKVMHLQAYPRNHLDEEAQLAHLSFPRETSSASEVDGLQDDCFFTLESDEEEANVFCLTRKELWSFGVKLSGSIRQDNLQLELWSKRRIKLPANILEANSSRLSARSHSGSCGVAYFTIIPRFLHVQDETLRQRQREKYREERESEDGSGWFSSIVNMIAGGEVPDQYAPEEVLPRFAFLDVLGNVLVWDPEMRSQRMICSNVTTMSRMFISVQASESWPTPCRLVYGLYGPDGMRVWLPLLDGVHLTHTKAFDRDEEALETFLACHDPLRAKTYEIEFGTAHATPELYEQVLHEYGIAFEHFGLNKDPKDREDGVRNSRGCITSVDDPLAKDAMLRFDSDVKVLGLEGTFGLLVGLSQDVYMPSGMYLPCYDVFCRVQPFFHPLLCYLVQNRQFAWTKQIIEAVRHQYALSTPTQELFLHSMLEFCFAKQCSVATLADTIRLLQPPTDAFASRIDVATTAGADHLQASNGAQGDIDEYCEIVAHVARKSEPSRLKLLFPLAGDPLELLAICRQRNELRTAANFLLILEESALSSSTEKNGSKEFRSACAAELVAQCIEHEELTLAKHVVRVARDWEHPVDDVADMDAAVTHRPPSTDSHALRCIDEELAKFMWNDLVSGNYERLAWCVEELQGKLPDASGTDQGLATAEDEASAVQQLRQTFIETKRAKQLRFLQQAVAEAHLDKWVKDTGAEDPRRGIYLDDDATYDKKHFLIPHHYQEHLESVLIPTGLIQDRVEKIAQDIRYDYEGKTIHLLCVLKGGSAFFHHLIEKLRLFHKYNKCTYVPFTFDFIKVKSYEGTQSTGNVQISGADLTKFRGKELLLVEDIIDTGKTMEKLVPLLKQYDPASVRVASLLEKRNPQSVGFKADYVGFNIPDKFVVGYCLDYNEVFRDLDHICVINEAGIAKYANNS
ncbi:TPA: hypothetical protein N0F65_003128 [Lagenidium giganteum]|uniref:ACB domain-containing protein n=1 Tax=Lagenidium giganteum TaxID=4803 RepID=A0AAV2YY93_9STRA|nr:TPA: hypothetical protein N0F65_003128 [Lagenidium giganteum]